jgi:hypothetical protein
MTYGVACAFWCSRVRHMSRVTLSLYYCHIGVRGASAHANVQEQCREPFIRAREERAPFTR